MDTRSRTIHKTFLLAVVLTFTLATGGSLTARAHQNDEKRMPLMQKVATVVRDFTEENLAGVYTNGQVDISQFLSSTITQVIDCPD